MVILPASRIPALRKTIRLPIGRVSRQQDSEDATFERVL